jgi:hypothetical protein
MNESSGSVVYGYDDNTALTTTPTARLISQTAGGVNSSIIDTTGFPVSNTTDRYRDVSSPAFFARVNGTGPLVLTLAHDVYDTFGVSPSGTGMVNVTNGWVIAGSPFSVLATPYIGQYFQYWQRDGVTEGTGNPGIVAATASHAYVAVFGPTPYVVPLTKSPDSVYWGIIFFYAFLLVMSILVISVGALRRFIIVLIFAFLDILFGLSQLVGSQLPASPWSGLFIILLGTLLIIASAESRSTTESAKGRR